MNTEDMPQLDAAVRQRLAAAQGDLDAAEAAFGLSGGQDVTLAELSQADRYAYVSASANLAAARASIAAVQAQLGLRWLLEDLVAVEKAPGL